MAPRFVLLSILSFAAAACGPDVSTESGSTNALTSDAKKRSDLSTAHDLGGTPTRLPCTSQFGTGLSATHGRLDGYLVSIVPPSDASGCNRDDAHVHLQVRMNDGVYDVAVDIGKSGDNIYDLEKDITTPDGTWSEGWHTNDNFSYTQIGVSAPQLAEQSPSAAATTVEDALANVNEISVFGTGYNENGMHLIHYNSGKDGAIVLSPTSSTSHLMLFRFSDDSF